VHALSIDDGSERDGFPIDVDGILFQETPFDASLANERGAIALVNDVLFIPYGSQGDCGDYRGAVVAIDLAHNNDVTAWVSPGLQAGIWFVSGVASDGTNIFFSTGNGRAASSSDQPWAGGDALMRFAAAPFVADPDSDLFAPSNWQDLDAADEDITGVMLVSQPQSTPSLLAIETGKDGFIYVHDAMNLGGVVGTDPLIKQQVASRNIAGGAAAVPDDDGTMVVVDAQTNGVGYGCPSGQSGNLIGVQIVAGSPPTAHVAWCAGNLGHGVPIITTIDGKNEAIVWSAGSGGAGKLRGYDALTGDVIFDGGDDSMAMTGIHRFSTLIAANGRLLVGADNQLHAFEY
jgi:hypothetical protein